MIARIHRPQRGATQSGRARTKAWRIDFERSAPREIEPLMGWTGSSETETQVKLSFDTKEEAIAFAERNGLDYRVEDPPPDQTRKGLSYSDNFSPNRAEPWTH